MKITTRRFEFDLTTAQLYIAHGERGLSVSWREPPCLAEHCPIFDRWVQGGEFFFDIFRRRVRVIYTPANWQARRAAEPTAAA
jgi:hypothetical protein